MLQRSGCRLIASVSLQRSQQALTRQFAHFIARQRGNEHQGSRYESGIDTAGKLLAELVGSFVWRYSKRREPPDHAGSCNVRLKYHGIAHARQTLQAAGELYQ